MPIDTRSRLFHVRFLQGGYSTESGFYGQDTYGEAQLTYGQEAGESTVAGVEYMIVPQPGSRPADPTWQFRVGDTTRQFTAAIVDRRNPDQRLDLTPIADAHLVITELRPFGGVYRRGFVLEWDPVEDVLVRQWFPDDLVRPGRYLVNIRLLFNSGRYMTLEPNDDITFEVYESAA